MTYLYIRLAIILFNESQRPVADGVVHRMVKRAVELEGTVTGEHGVGLVKRDYLDHELGKATVDAMRKVRWSRFSFPHPIHHSSYSDTHLLHFLSSPLGLI